MSVDDINVSIVLCALYSKNVGLHFWRHCLQRAEILGKKPHLKINAPKLEIKVLVWEMSPDLGCE